MLIRLLDTAGLRAFESDLEREGIARTEKSLQLADLRLHIADRNAPKPAHFNSRKLSEFNGRAGETNDILVLNKSDLPEASEWKDFPALRISCATGDGVLDLQRGNSGAYSPAKPEAGKPDRDQYAASRLPSSCFGIMRSRADGPGRGIVGEIRCR